jgi:TatD DNase family protein
MLETFGRDIEHVLCVSVTLEKYPDMRQLVDGYQNISVSVGVHPDERDCREPTCGELIRLAEDPKVVAIGETGLDYYRSVGDITWQQERFRQHIQAAKITQKPLIVHTRAARGDTLKILAQEGADEVGGVFHCFTEDWETAKRALDLNFYISFSGILTFKNAELIQHVAKKVPEDRLLVETDSPYLAPIPHRGKPNYPFHVYHVAEFLAKLREVPLADIARITSQNFYALFSMVPNLSNNRANAV